MMDLDQNLFPSTASFGAFFLFPLIMFIMSFNTDVGVVINDYHRHLRGEGGGVFTTVMYVVLAMTTMGPQFAYNYPE